MAQKLGLADLGLGRRDFDRGSRNSITDVDGVRVGHATLSRDEVRTGVTAIVPHGGNTFRDKLPAAAHVINGFGKSMGLIQIEELGTLETPIILTNTFSVGTAASGLIEYMLAANPDIGVTTGTVNPVVCECNDGHLNDIRGMHVRRQHIHSALDAAAEEFAQGAVGAGTGMCAYELKGGVGSASCCAVAEDQVFTIGALVLTNMGRLTDLIVAGRPVGRMIAERTVSEDGGRTVGRTTSERMVSEDDSRKGAGRHEGGKPAGSPTARDGHNDRGKPTGSPAARDGSIIIVLAMDAPLNERQLKRIAKRAVVGAAMTGSRIDSGSGEIVIAFSTASRIPHYPEAVVATTHRLHEEYLNDFFRAAAQCTEEAILNSMLAATSTTGFQGHTVYSLGDYADLFIEGHA